MSSSSSNNIPQLANERARDIADAIPDLTPAELRTLLKHIADDRLKDVVQMVGMSALASQLDPAFAKLLRASAPSAPARSAPPATSAKNSATPPVPAAQGSRVPPAPTAKAKGKRAVKATRDPVVVIPDSPPSDSALLDSPPADSPPPSPQLASAPLTFPPVPNRSAPATPTSIPRYHYHTPETSGYTNDWLEAAAMKAKDPNNRAYKTGSHYDLKGYVLFLGAPGVGVYDNGTALSQATADYPKAVFCSFPTLAAAQAAWDDAQSRGWTGHSAHQLTLPAPRSQSPQPLVTHHPPSPLISGTHWYVVSYGANPGVYASYLEAKVNCLLIEDAVFTKYPTRVLAETAYQRALDNGWCGVRRARQLRM
ncbi:hypothetical protein R3P38DRAFT_2785662 [Favolaschia claudopus]|uniref:Ribonuclease H1 N-terminal domain-containing protein n=1 Tax=Favolaschia claudopus TaxID=2862362 RepID=A0AAW0AUJ7_9AGAR